MLNDRAGVIDDLILYRMEPETFFVVVNASKIEKTSHGFPPINLQA